MRPSTCIAALLLGLIPLYAVAGTAGETAHPADTAPAATGGERAAEPAAEPANDAATTLAFDALLSLPQAEAEFGSWDKLAPVDFRDASEAGLIRWLQRQRKAGADLNAERHKGTLLQHAIRAGLEDTALWLLQQGADPLRTGQDLPTGDALTLAMSSRRWKVLEVLLRRADVTAAARDVQIGGIWQQALHDPANGDLQRLLDHGLRWPQGRPGALGIDAAESANCYGLLLRVVPELNTAGSASDATGIPLCGVVPSGETLRRLDAGLAKPLYPQLLRNARSREELDALAALPLRRPYDDPAFLRSVLNTILYRLKNSELEMHALRQIPAAQLQAALADNYMFRDWLRWAAVLPADYGDWALQQLGDSLAPRAALALKSMTEGLVGTDIIGFDPRAGTPQLSAGWGRLLARLPAPLPAVNNLDLLSIVPAEQRPLLLQRGYRPDDNELSRWLRNANAEAIGKLWPVLAEAVPERRANIVELLFQGYGFTRGEGCRQAWPQPDLLPKAQLLLAAGAAQAAPLPLPQRCFDEGQRLDKPVWQALLAAGFVKRDTPDKRFVQMPIECRFQPDAVWRRALLGHPDQFQLPLRFAKLLPLPGTTDCAVLVTAGSGGGRETVVEESLYGREVYSGGCAEEITEIAILRRQGDALAQLRMDNFPHLRNLCLLQDLRDGSPLLLSGIADDRDSCGIMPPTLLRWTDPTAPPQALGADSEQGQALEELCRMDPHDPLCSECGGYSGGIRDFIDEHWAAEKRSFLAAVSALDYPQLARQREAGLPPHWIADALEEVSDATLALEDKRKRIAWLLRQPSLDESTLVYSSSIEKLTKWLPTQDWKPLIAAAGSNDHLLAAGLKAALEQGRDDLACRWQQARGTPCAAPSP